jgi:hypothetical protein
MVGHMKYERVGSYREVLFAFIWVFAAACGMNCARVQGQEHQPPVTVEAHRNHITNPLHLSSAQSRFCQRRDVSPSLDRDEIAAPPQLRTGLVPIAVRLLV